MTIYLATEVEGYYLDVMNRFDRTLFEALSPPFGMNIEKFTGSKKGDQVILKFSFPAKFTWQSDIIENGKNQERAWFIDEGKILPWPLKSWRHEHIVEYISQDRSRIVDKMTFTCSGTILTKAIRPLMVAAFYPRKRIYKQFFSQN